jgi:release factor glutamine methyltransferase
MRERAVELTYLGTSLLIPPPVFVPTPVSPLLGKAVLKEVQTTDKVLDVGTGSGVNAILAASKARNVVAVDINPASIICAERNAKRNGVESHISFLVSDLFNNVSGRFDLIIFDPPFRWFKPKSVEERARTDENYTTLTTFFQQAKSHLHPGGRILLFFGTSGDINYVRHLITRTGLTKRIVASQEITNDGWKFRYFTYKLTKHLKPDT